MEFSIGRTVFALRNWINDMPIEQHKKAADSFKKATDMHDKASTKYKAGNADKGASADQAAHDHKEEAMNASTEASKEHAKKYGTK
ncbi:MAG: hypothetical protein K2X09_04170 [Rickettsiales bacterium]|nr:hypothetical protein [Rickettsiales bacterium]